MANTYLNNLLGEREKLLLVTHQHWFLLLRAILPEILMIILIFIGTTVLYFFVVPPNPLIWLGYALIILPVISIIRDYLIWHNHEYVITNRRVIQIFGVFNKNVTDSSLEKVNDVKMDQSVMGRLFDFGDIEILTASELGINRFTFIGDPVRFKTAMLNAKFELEQDHGEGYFGTAPSMDVPRLIQDLDRLRQQGVITEAEFQQKKAKLLSQI